jgi:hypothetical protein
MTRRSAVIALPAGFAWAADQWWDKKEASTWTGKDVQKIMSKSPWAHEVTVDMGGGPSAPNMSGGGGGRGGRGGGMGGGGMDSGMGGMGGGGRASGGGGMGGGGMDGGGGMGGGGMDGGGMGGGMPQIKATVRWESAAIIQDALKRQLPESAKGHYLISVNGLPTMGMGGPGGPGGADRGGKQGPPDPAQMEERRKRMMEGLKLNTELQRKGKDPIKPANVFQQRGNILLFLFPEGGDPISADDKEVVFLCKMGRMQVKSKFVPKEMMYKGKLAV